MLNLQKLIIIYSSYFPFARFILKVLYLYSLRRFKRIIREYDEIRDVYLISKLHDKNFVFGLSDMNFVIVVDNDAYPKQILKELRKNLKNSFPANILIDKERLPIIYEKEFETPLIRSFLISDINNNEVSWFSILQNKRVNFNCPPQGRYAMKFFLMRKLEIFFMHSSNIVLHKNWLRSYGKFIDLALKNLSVEGLLKNSMDPQYQKLSQKIFSLSPLARFYYPKHNVHTWKLLASEKIPFQRYLGNSKDYPVELIQFCEKLMVQDCVEDILLTPALLQIHDNQVRGKVFIDVLLSERVSELEYGKIKNIRKLIQDFDEDNELQESIRLKTDFKLSTLSLLELQSQKSLFPYPLEVYYRQRKTFSVRGRKYLIKVSKPIIEKSIIHFTLLQFMRFRSAEFKTGLIGSRFIKSLNLMNRYILILEYLEKKDFVVPNNYEDMLAKITPQLSHMKPNQEVTKEQWPLIQAQLLYTLKKIRDILSNEHPSIRNLTF
tara:strand:+ start:31147 stop:32622 length:1476 start_codon:yes stop_codon:yes gene_type:complete